VWVAVRCFLHRLPPDDLGHRFARETLSPATRDFEWVGFAVPDAARGAQGIEVDLPFGMARNNGEN